ncbi:ATP-binding protein [Rhizobium leguminosarum]|uniref:ATP-binding protein n=1 Tax=Rhizobium leguminosarum TaxID=384 RepID=UPI0013DBB394|nr:ATP-binding protein [Rhizobium leguminosarum]MBY5312683.1 ATP-binding protein [Rhizobium leguminosarum]NEH49070.1 ATP-binding protein [Rhizobium leguminosarum]
MTSKLIPFQIETQRVIQLLAKQIYQSPLALLRENTQNAFDAIRQRLHRGDDFEPRIDIQLFTNKIIISDNGLGMTPDDLSQHYWKAGSSSKNNDEARAAGVVGTFGIGAMANFGIADELTVETESALSGERTLCKAIKEKLSLTEDCIEMDSVDSKGEPGTTIEAKISSGSEIDIERAKNYVSEFISLVEVPVYVNGQMISCKPVESYVPNIPETWRDNRAACILGNRFSANVEIVLSNNADIWIKLTKLVWDEKPLTGRLVLRSGHPNLQTFRSGFGLATASVSSAYQFGGVADLLVLEPTAGREALTVDGMQLLQSMVHEIDSYISVELSKHEECDASTAFMNWVATRNRFDLCGLLKITIQPGDRLTLSEISSLTKSKPMMLYEGTDQSIIKLHANEDSPLLLAARSNPRRKCEQGFLQQYAKIETVSNKPVITNLRRWTDLSAAESGLAFRVESILESDYFLKSQVVYGDISHQLPILAEKEGSSVRIVLNPDGATLKMLFGLFDRDYASFGSMAKDFVRTIIFPKISEFVPSSTRQGAEAFLKAIRRPRELFEYADDDLGTLPKIWEDYQEGLISMEQAVQRSQSAVRGSVQFVDMNASRNVHEVVPDIIENETALQQAEADIAVNFEAAPAITRLDNSSSAKLLVLSGDEPPLRGYRNFLAITDKVREEMGDFFLQPHKTSVVWGGQKTLFIFLHHSGQFGLYYDLQTRDVVDAPAGGGAFPSCTIVLKDRIYIPVPESIAQSFVPTAGERKRFEVRADILRTDAP